MENQVSALLKDRNNVPDEEHEEEASDTNQDPSSSSPDQPASPPPSPVPTQYPAVQNVSQQAEYGEHLSVQYSTQQQQPSDNKVNMDLNKASGAENTLTPVIDNSAMENSQPTSKYYFNGLLV
jgi:hypothetical protein